MNLYINGFSSITKKGMLSSLKGKIDFLNNETPLTIGRKSVYSKLHTGFGKLNPPDKLAFSAASLILDNIENLDKENTGIVLGTLSGSASTDFRYIESIKEGFPSPAYFQATLPSSPVAEVAILFKLKGPDRIFSSSNGSGIEALNGAIRLLVLNKATSVLVLFINGIDSCDSSNPLLKEVNKEPFAFGLLISTQKNETSLNFTFQSSYGGNNKKVDSEVEVAYFNKLINDLYSTGNFNTSCNNGKLIMNIQIKKES